MSIVGFESMFSLSYIDLRRHPRGGSLQSSIPSASPDGVRFLTAGWV
jgi:hypothetical protein